MGGCTTGSSIHSTGGRFCCIGEGAGLAGPVLAGPLFRRFNIKIGPALRVCLLQQDHFKSPSYAPVLSLHQPLRGNHTLFPSPFLLCALVYKYITDDTECLSHTHGIAATHICSIYGSKLIIIVPMAPM